MLLFGRNPALSDQLVRVAGGLFVLSLFAYLPVRAVDAVALDGPLVTAVLMLAMVSAAAVAAHANDGLFPAIAVVAGIGVGFYAPAILFELRDPSDAAVWVLVVGSFTSLVAGVVGFAVGAGLKRLRS